ncbi:MAG: cytochrome c oxidase subunit II [Dehalococcoidia bacterium]
MCAAALLGALGAMLGGCRAAPSTLDPHGPAASRIATLWWALLVTATAVVIVVTLLLLLALVRRRGGDLGTRLRPGSDRFGHGLIVVAGLIVPGIVLIGVIVLTAHTLRAVGAPDAPGDVTVEVVGHDWWWEVRYPAEGVITANEIHIPAGRSILVKVTSVDVIHSFWAPQLHGKIDAIPGQMNSISLRADAPGTFRGQCAEYCGVQHAHMAFLVIAESPSSFAAWLEEQRRPPAALTGAPAAGRQVFERAACVSCHAADEGGTRVGPDLTHLGSRRTLAAGVLPNTPENLSAWIRNPAAFKPGVNMPPSALSQEEMDALTAYLGSLK